MTKLVKILVFFSTLTLSNFLGANFAFGATYNIGGDVINFSQTQDLHRNYSPYALYTTFTAVNGDVYFIRQSSTNPTQYVVAVAPTEIGGGYVRLVGYSTVTKKFYGIVGGYNTSNSLHLNFTANDVYDTFTPEGPHKVSANSALPYWTLTNGFAYSPYLYGLTNPYRDASLVSIVPTISGITSNSVVVTFNVSGVGSCTITATPYDPLPGVPTIETESSCSGTETILVSPLLANKNYQLQVVFTPTSGPVQQSSIVSFTTLQAFSYQTSGFSYTPNGFIYSNFIPAVGYSGGELFFDITTPNNSTVTFGPVTNYGFDVQTYVNLPYHNQFGYYQTQARYVYNGISYDLENTGLYEVTLSYEYTPIVEEVPLFSLFATYCPVDLEEHSYITLSDSFGFWMLQDNINCLVGVFASAFSPGDLVSDTFKNPNGSGTFSGYSKTPQGGNSFSALISLILVLYAFLLGKFWISIFKT